MYDLIFSIVIEFCAFFDHIILHSFVFFVKVVYALDNYVHEGLVAEFGDLVLLPIRRRMQSRKVNVLYLLIEIHKFANVIFFDVKVCRHEYRLLWMLLVINLVFYVLMLKLKVDEFLLDLFGSSLHAVNLPLFISLPLIFAHTLII